MKRKILISLFVLSAVMLCINHFNLIFETVNAASNCDSNGNCCDYDDTLSGTTCSYTSKVSKWKCSRTMANGYGGVCNCWGSVGITTVSCTDASGLNCQALCASLHGYDNTTGNNCSVRYETFTDTFTESSGLSYPSCPNGYSGAVVAERECRISSHTLSDGKCTYPLSSSSTLSKCANGEYYDGDSSTCKSCPSSYPSSTKGTNGSINRCYKECSAGQYYDGTSCVACPIGTYKASASTWYYNNHGEASTSCTACPTGQTTSGTGKTSANDCYTPDSIVEVTDLTVSPKTSEIKVGDSVQLTATITPSDATVTTVTWTSSDPTIATVDSNGKVTGIKEGTVTITATTTDGSKSDTATVIVKPSTAINIIFDCNGGSGTMQNMVVEYGQTVTLNENKCTRSNNTFKEWKGYIGTTEIQNGTFSDKASFTNTYTEDVTLKAVWNSSNTYLIHYYADGGNGSMADTTATNDTTGTLRKNTFTRSDYTFAGWKAYYTDSDGNLTALKDSNGKEIEFKNQAKFKNLYGPNHEEVTLHAQWNIVNPNTGIFASIIIIGTLTLGAAGYYLIKTKNTTLE